MIRGTAARTLRERANTRTPIATVAVRVNGSARLLGLKLEGYNPTGSIKYRTALGLLAALDEVDPIVSGTRVVESTSGNLGIALAALLQEMRCRLVAVVDPKVPQHVRDMITRYDGELVEVNTRDVHGGYLLSRLGVVADLLQRDEQLRWTDQYSSRANPDIHRDTITGELIEQTAGTVDAVLIAVSTGGTLVGISDGLRAASSLARVYAVDVAGSLVTSDSARPHLLTGIGATRKSAFLHAGHYFRALRVRDVAAIAVCRKLRRETGLAIGGSGGAVIAAFIDAMADGDLLGRASCPVALIADGGDNYFSTIYDDAWLDKYGALAEVGRSEALLARSGVGFEMVGGANG